MTDFDFTLPPQGGFTTHGLSQERDRWRERAERAERLLCLVRAIVRASVAMETTSSADVGAFIDAMNAHKNATMALPADVRAWAQGGGNGQ